MTGTSWLDLRKAQNPARSFGPSSTAVWSAFRMVLPFNEQGAGLREVPIHELASAFIREHAAAGFFPTNDREPVAGP